MKNILLSLLSLLAFGNLSAQTSADKGGGLY